MLIAKMASRVSVSARESWVKIDINRAAPLNRADKLRIMLELWESGGSVCDRSRSGIGYYLLKTSQSLGASRLILKRNRFNAL